MPVVAEWDSGSTATAGATMVGGATVLTNNRMGMGDSVSFPAGTTAAYLRLPLVTGAYDTFYGTFYFRTPTEWPSAAASIVAFRPSNAVMAYGFSIAGTGSPGQFRVVATGGTTIQSSPTGTLQLDTVYRVNFWLTGTTTGDRTISGSLYQFGSVEELWAYSGSIPSASQTALIQVDFGKINNTPSTTEFGIDAITIGDDPTPVFEPHPDDPASAVVPEEPEDPEEPEQFFGFTGDINDTSMLVGTDISVAPGAGLQGSNTQVENGSYVVSQTSGVGYLQHLPSPAAETVVTQVYFRVYDAWPSASFGLITLRFEPATVLCALTISGAGQPGQGRLTGPGGATIQQSANNTLSVDTWYRGELQYDKTTGKARAGIFAMGTDVPLWSSDWQAHASFTQSISHVQIGRVTNSPVVSGLELEEAYGVYGIQDPDWIGRYIDIDPLPPEPTYDLNIWDGTELLAVSTQDQNGDFYSINDFFIWDGATLRPFRPQAAPPVE